MDIPDLVVPLFGILMGGIVVLIPVLGLTARFGIKPLVDSWTQSRAAPGSDERLKILESRIALLEQHVEGLERQNERLLEEADFRLKLNR